MAANQKTNLSGTNPDTVVLDEEYTAPTPEERGDFIPEDDAEIDDVEISDDDDGADEEHDEHDDEDADDEHDDEGEDDGEADDLEEEQDANDDSASDDSDDAEEDGEPESKSSKSNGNKRVPLNRLNKEIEKRRVVEGQLADMQKQLDQLGANDDKGGNSDEAPAQAFTRDDFEGMQEAMLDGETDKAFDLFGRMMSSQSDLVRKSTEEEVSGRVRSELEQDRAHQELQSTAATLSESFPELDSGNEDADQGLIEEVVEMRDIYVGRGLSLSDALKRSVKLVALENSLEDRTAKPKADMGAPSGKRKAVNSKRKLEAAKREKGKLAGSGLRNSRKRVDISNMPEEEFRELSKEALAQARGDYIV